MKKLEIKGWLAIVFGIFAWPVWLIYSIIWAVAYLTVVLLCVIVLKPAELISNYIKYKRNERLQNQSNHQ